MTITPTTSLAKLGRLRGRERLFRVIWGVAQWLALALTLATVAMIADWWIDKSRETPMWVRISLTLVQTVAFAVAAYFWILRPLAKGPNLIRLARRVEKHFPEFDHRLITAIQLTRSGAKTEGMSAELIGVVTNEAERLSDKHDLASLADSRRLKWSAALLAWPMSVLAFLLLFFKPALLIVLLQRQFLADVEIPRDNQIKSITPVLWASGDEVVIRYEVTGRVGANDRKKVYVNVENQPEADYDLTPETEFDGHKTILSVKVPHSSVNFSYRARIGDGRTKKADEIRFETRPIVTIYGAWTAMPDYVPLRPDGSRYETAFPNGDIRAFNGGRARVRIHVQKPISDATLILFKKGGANLNDVEAKRIALDLLEPQSSENDSTHYPAEAAFILQAGEGLPELVSYRIEVKDQFGFMNVKEPVTTTMKTLADGTEVAQSKISSEHVRRSIGVVEPDPPFVKFLKERYPGPEGVGADDIDFEGMPIPLGGSIPIDWMFRSTIGVPGPDRGPQGLLSAPAWLVYRVNEETEETRYPLTEILESEVSGPYDIQKATFAMPAYMKKLNKDGNGVEFTAVSVADPMNEIPRREGGGHFDFRTKSLRKKGSDGKDRDLEIGDKVIYRIEVYDRHPNSRKSRPLGKSSEQAKIILSAEEVMRRGFELLESEQKLRALEKRQQGVFTKRKE